MQDYEEPGYLLAGLLFIHVKSLSCMDLLVNGAPGYPQQSGFQVYTGPQETFNNLGSRRIHGPGDPH